MSEFTFPAKWVPYLEWLDENLERYFLIASYFYIVLIIIVSVFSRFVLRYTPIYSNETAIFLYIYLSWVGASLGIRKRIHIKINLLHRYVSEKVKNIIYITGDVTVIFFVIFVMIGIWPVIQNALEYGTTTQALRVNEVFFLLAIPLGFLLMSIRSIQMLIIDINNFINGNPAYDGERIMGGE